MGRRCWLVLVQLAGGQRAKFGDLGIRSERGFWQNLPAHLRVEGEMRVVLGKRRQFRPGTRDRPTLAARGELVFIRRKNSLVAAMDSLELLSESLFVLFLV